MKVNTDAIVTHKKDALVQSEREEGKGSASKLTEHVQLMYESNCAHPKLADDRVRNRAHQRRRRCVGHPNSQEPSGCHEAEQHPRRRGATLLNEPQGEPSMQSTFLQP